MPPPGLSQVLRGRQMAARIVEYPANPSAGAVRLLSLFALRAEQLWYVTILAIAFLTAVVQVVITVDTWWALKMGQLSIILGRPVLDVVLAHAPTEVDAVNGQWLGQVVIYLLYSGLGEAGLRMVAATLVVTTVALVMAAAREEGSPFSAVAAGLLALALMLEQLAVRSQLLTYPLFALLLLLLQRARRSPRGLVVAPAIIALWANLHGSFVVGLGLIGLYTLGETFDALRQSAPGRSPGRGVLIGLALALLGAVAAVSLNPLGPAVYTYVLGVGSHSTIRENIVEWAPTTVRSLSGQLLIVSLGLVCAVLRVSQRRLAAREVLLVPAFAYLALNGTRHVVWHGLLLGAVLAPHLSQLAAPGWHRRYRAAPGADEQHRRWLNGLLAGLVLTVAVSGPLWAPGWSTPSQPAPGSPHALPSAAADFLEQLPSGSRLYNYELWNSYFAWRLWPNQQTMIDLRYEAYPREVMEDYFAVYWRQADWETILAQYEIDYLVLHRTIQADLVTLAEASGRWNRLYADDVAVVLGRIRA